MRAVVAVLLLGTVAGPGIALAQSQGQSAAIGARVDRLEHEMRAVQRKVFPGSPDGRYVEPENGPDTSAAPAPGAPASSPVADLAARVSSLEDQLARLTDRVEVTQHRVQQLEDGFTTYRRTTDQRLAALEAGPAPIGPAPAPSATPIRPKPSASPAAATDDNDKDPTRANRLASIERPHTDNAADDAYLYGYRLWDAKLYPEAEAALKDVVTTYPKDRRASYAQNLLGRAYLDDGKPSLASIALYDSYKKYPDGERAPESLYYLAQALMKLNKPNDACKVYGELSDVYGAKLTAQRKADIVRGRAAANCS